MTTQKPPHFLTIPFSTELTSEFRVSQNPHASMFPESPLTIEWGYHLKLTRDNGQEIDEWLPTHTWNTPLSPRMAIEKFIDRLMSDLREAMGELSWENKEVKYRDHLLEIDFADRGSGVTVCMISEPYTSTNYRHEPVVRYRAIGSVVAPTPAAALWEGRKFIIRHLSVSKAN